MSYLPGAVSKSARRLANFMGVRLPAWLLGVCFAFGGGYHVDAGETGTVDLGVSIRESSLLPLINQVMTYSITVTNRGPETATGVELVNHLPPGALFLGCTLDVGTKTVAGGDVTWTIGNLAIGQSVSAQIQVTLPLLGAAVDQAEVTCLQTDSNSSDNSATSTVTTLLGGLPQILSQPQSKQVLPGLPVSIDVAASSDLPVRYQWRRNGVSIPGETNSTLSIPSFQTELGGSYTVQVINDLGVVSSQPAQLSPVLSAGLPFVDNFADSHVVTGLTVIGLGENLSATVETGEPQHGGKVVGKTVWLTWRPLLGGIATIRTTGSTFDTVLAVYTGDSLATLVPLVSDDDGGGFRSSLVTFNAVAGRDYHIVVAGYDGASGLIAMTLGCEITGDKVPSITTQPVGQTVPQGGSVNLSVAATGSGLTYQWLRDGVEVPGADGPQFQIASVGVEQVGVYQVKITSGKRSVISDKASVQLFIPGPGEPFQDVRAEDKLTDLLRSLLGSILPLDGLIWSDPKQTTVAASSQKSTKYSKPTGNEPAIKSTARGYTGTHVFSTYGSSSQSGEPNHCESPGGASEWVGYQPPEDGVLTLDTDGSNFDTILAVYVGDGSSFDSLQSVACDDNSGSNGKTSKVVFNVHANATYFIAVDGANGQSGTVVLNYDLAIPPKITFQTSNQIVAAGSTVQLTVNVTGRPVPQLKWSLNGNDLVSTTNTTLEISDVSTKDEGAYQVVANNSAGQIVSDPISVLIDAPLKLESMKIDDSKMAKFRIAGLHSKTYLIQASTNLIQWITISTNYSDSGILSYLDCHSTNQPCRFYRAVPQ